LADASPIYESVSGIVQVARDNNKTVVLAATKTKPSDATLDDFRALRRAVNKAALNGRLSAYYLDTTWEARLPAFRTAAEPHIYQRLPDGSAILDRKFLFLAMGISNARRSFKTFWPRFLELLPSGYSVSRVAEFFRHLDLGQIQQPFDLGTALGH